MFLEIQSVHTSFESSSSNSEKKYEFGDKFDLSDTIDSFAISDKPTEQIDNVINVSHPKLYALSIDGSFEFIRITKLLKIQGYLCI